MKHLIDPTWRVNPQRPSARAVVVAPNTAGELPCVIHWMGREMSARSAGGLPLTAGEAVSYVESSDGPPWVVKVDEELGADYPTRFSRQLAEWGNKAGASLLLRYIMRNNPKGLMYRTVKVTGFDAETGIATFDGGSARVRFGGADAIVAEGDVALLVDFGTSRHVIGGKPDEQGGAGTWDPETGDGEFKPKPSWVVRARKINTLSYPLPVPSGTPLYGFAVSPTSDRIVVTYNTSYCGDVYGVEGGPGTQYLFERGDFLVVSAVDGSIITGPVRGRRTSAETGLWIGDDILFGRGAEGAAISSDSGTSWGGFAPSVALRQGFSFTNGVVAMLAWTLGANTMALDIYAPPLIANYAPLHKIGTMPVGSNLYWGSFADVSDSTALLTVSNLAVGNTASRLYFFTSSGEIREIAVPACGIASVVVLNLRTWLLLSVDKDATWVTRDAGETWEQQESACDLFFLRSLRFKGGALAFGVSMQEPLYAWQPNWTIKTPHEDSACAFSLDKDGKVVVSSEAIERHPRIDPDGEGGVEPQDWPGRIASLNAVTTSADRTKIFASYLLGADDDPHTTNLEYSTVEITYGE